MSRSKSERWKKQEPEEDPRMRLASLSALVLISGFASLVYQVLWMRHLGLLFGNGSQAAAATLAMFFAGLGVGSWWWGKRVSGRPLRLYALLELGIVASALAYFVVKFAIEAIYPAVYAALAGTSWILIAKLVMAGLLIFPGAFFMGGTIPAMGQVAVAERSRFGRISAWLYGMNTFGAMLGVMVGAFVLLPSLGLRMSYGIAMLCSLMVSAWAWMGAKSEVELEVNNTMDEGSGRLDPGIATFAFVSGFVVLGLEVAWTRIFAQVHENSVYSFAVILAVVLFGLAFGSAISSLLSRLNKPPKQILLVILLVSGGLIVCGPWMMMSATKELQPVHTSESWAAYITGIFRMGFGGVGFTAIALGVVFPFLMKMAERDVRRPGRMLGRLLAVNTSGAIMGSLFCGFILLPTVGMWGAVKWLAILHLGVALILTRKWGSMVIRVSMLALIVIAISVFGLLKLPLLSQLPGGADFKILEIWQGSDCTVAAIEKESGHRAILINASYSLGSTAAYLEQANQSRIPLYLYPETKSICYIGIGTGMSVGASLDRERFPNVERVLACELSPSVIKAAEKHIPEDKLGGLFEDERCEILIEDGRHHLMASEECFDMINADLFLPYRRGAGSLYSLDHYEVVAERLNEAGVFVQWLPMYQITEFEFGVIVNTMLQVFDEVTLWRNTFSWGEKVALIGKLKSGPVAVPPVGDRELMRSAVMGLQLRETSADMVQVEPESMPFLYAGNLSEARALFEGYPVNTDNHPIIEFQTPWRFRKAAATDRVIWCIGPNLTAWIERIFMEAPLVEDPVFQYHPRSSLHLVSAGRAFHQAMVAKVLNKSENAETWWNQFRKQWVLAATSE